jgi:hypothetical protein
LIPHWLVLIGHALRVAWPYVATVVALAVGHFSWFLVGELDAKDARIKAVEARLLQANATWAEHRCYERIDEQLQAAYDYARDWEQRYRLQLHRCEVEHIERPLPTMPLTAEQARELEQGLPF